MQSIEPGMCNCTSENLEIPRCAIAHLRSGANAPSRNDGRLAPHRIRAAPLQRPGIGRTGVNALQKRHRLEMALLEAATLSRRFQRKAHLDVGGGELIAGKPRSVAEFAFPERDVLLELWLDHR